MFEFVVVVVFRTFFRQLAMYSDDGVDFSCNEVTGGVIVLIIALTIVFLFLDQG